MKKFFFFFINNIKIIVVIYASIHILYLVTYDFSYSSDSLYYFRLAQESIQNNSFYPAGMHLYEDFISAPLYINLLIIVLSVYNSPISISILNIIINLIQLLLVYRITLHLFNKEAAGIAALLYIFYLNNLGLILLNITELLFTTLVLLSFYLYLKGSNKNYFLAGIAAAASVGVRPAGFNLLAAMALVFLICIFKKETVYKKILFYLTGFLLFIFSFGFFTQSNFEKFIYTSTNGPGNLLIGANDYTTGGFKDEVFREGNPAYIENPRTKTYIEKGKFWQSLAINWIKENPVKWISYIPSKLFHTFAWDEISVSLLTYSKDWDLYKAVKYVAGNKSLNGLFEGKSFAFKASFVSIQFFHHLYYFVLMFLIIYGILLAYRNNVNKEALRLLCSFIFLNLLLHMVVFGSPRFKYPYLIASLPYAAYFIQNYLKQRNESR
jgi:4-amino-4-deoxy-L-arabinose transferase-like glycosyltransferase